MLTTDEIKLFIENDRTSYKKQQAMVGQRYYNAQHDILKHRIFFVNAEGRLEEDKLKSNFRICHPFFNMLTNQQAQYMLSSKESFVRSDIPELQTELDAYFNDNESFTKELMELLKGTVSKGFEYMYAYKDEDGRTTFECADSLGVVEVRAKETDDGCDYLIYSYIDRIDKDSRAIKRIQVWDDKQTYFYCQVDDGEIEVDDSQELNPRPHTIYKKNGSKKLFSSNYGQIPFFRLDNNKQQQSSLYVIKSNIDDYDIHSCSLSNNLEDTNESLYVVKGFQGDNLDELMQNIKAKKHIGVDEDGGVDIKTIDIPFEARKAKMEIAEKSIFRFGGGVNTAALKDTSATTSVAIKSAYSDLDLKCAGLLPYLKEFMRKLLKVVLAEINELNGTDYQQKDVWFYYEPEIITNAQENAQIKLTEAQEQQTRVTTILNTAAQFGPELTMQNLCEVLQIDYDDIKDKLPKPEEDPLYAAQNNLQNAPVEEPDSGAGDLSA